MTLIQLTSKRITLPELRIKELNIGGNKILRYALMAQELEVEVYDSDYKGWYELRTKLNHPYNQVFLRKPKSKSPIPAQKFCLQSSYEYLLDEIDEKKKLKWLQHPSMMNSLSENEIPLSWANQFKFIEGSPNQNLLGLRSPQLGAIHSIAAYFSVKKNSEPATVVLPTGTGKTETMLSVMVYKQISKLLILVPSNVLRKQISEKFFGLGKLIDLGVVPISINFPSVATITASISSIEEAKELLQNANVFVATASVLSVSDSEAVNALCNGMDYLFVDEAHHISAATWSKIRERFESKKVVQFTATPFRNDGTALGGRIIYNFTMGEAQDADYFTHIDLIAVEEYYLGAGDKAIAKSAIKKLRADLSNDFDHLLMARVDKQARAHELLPIYQELAPAFKPIVIHSGMGKNNETNAIRKLFSRESRIVICVNMLGEGFDLHNLKIAAIHDIHKSLAITLQFIGRFTRRSSGAASAVVNIAEPEVEASLQRLYSQGADWDCVLRRLSENRIEREIKLQDVVEGLKEKGNLHKQVSLWNLRPVFSAMLFKTTCNAWLPEMFTEVLPKNTEHWFAINESEKILVVLAMHEAPVKWGNYKDLNDNLYKLLIAQWDAERSGLFVFANDYKWFRVEKMAESLCNKQCEILSGPQIFNIFNGLQYPLVRNLGASQIGAISFTQYFGSNVTEGLNRIESAKSNLSNLAGLGYDNGEKVIWGCSQKKGKVWSVNSGPISDWSAWVKTAFDKVTKGDVDETNITRDFLRPKRIGEPYAEYATSIQWGDHIQSEPEDRVMIVFGEIEVPLYLVDLQIEAQGNGLPYLISISSENCKSIYKFTVSEKLNGGFSYEILSGHAIKIRRGSNSEKPIEEHLQSDPWIIQYVDGSFSYNCFLIKLPMNLGEFQKEMIESLDWKDTDITSESMGRARQSNTVQWLSFLKFKDQYDVIINDDGPGEAADLVCLKIVDNEIRLGLIHCKYSGSQQPGARIDDLYEVCGQAQKSIRWKHSGIGKLFVHIKNREEKWQEKGFSRFLKGSMSDLANIKRRARTTQTKLHVCVVQPGIKKDRVTTEMLRLMGCTASYLKNTAQAELVVIGSI